MTADNVTPFPADGPPDKQELEAIADAIAEAGKANSQLPQGPPPALTPAKIEALMQRFYQVEEMRERADFKRPADPQDQDAGLADLSPLAQVVLSCTRNGGPEAQGITFMYAAYGLYCYYRDVVSKEAK